MRQFVVVLCLAAAFAAACHRRAAEKPAPPFDGHAFITSNLQTFLANNDLGEMAAKRGRVAETREFGATMHREQRQLFDALSAVAQRKNIAIPKGVTEKKAAQKENLSILPGQVFDRAYALAMLQDSNTAARDFQTASACGDRDIESFAKQNLPLITAEQQKANALLKQLGGSPFGFVPQ